MRIVKRLSKENLDRTLSGNIRIGSLFYYRKIEDELRKDSSEGFRGKKLKPNSSEKRVLNADEMNRFLRATGAGFQVSEKVKFHLQPGAVMSSGSPLINTFVYCASKEDDGSGILDQKFGTYKIELFDTEKFSYLVLMALNQELHFKKSVKMTGVASGIGCTHKSVTYDNKDDLVVESIEKLPEKPFVDIEEIFIKPKGFGFEEENEYHFIWYPLNPKDETMFGIAYDFDYIDLHIPNIGEAIRDAT